MSGTPRHLAVADTSIDVTLIALAGWTVTFHVALVAGWSRTATLVVATTVIGGLLAAFGRLPATRLSGPDAPAHVADARGGRTIWLVVGAAGVVSALTTLVRPSGTAFVVVWAAVLAASTAAIWVIRSDRRPRVPVVADLPTWSIWVVAGLAALLTLVLVRQDLDDVELINRSLYIEQDAGPFPTRDTVIADEVFASDRPENPATSIEALIGSVAALVPVNATTVAHLWLAPLVSALGVLALHRLLSSMRSSAPALATSAAWFWLILDGEVLRSLGNHHAPRAWQGKAVLLIVVLPALWHHALRWHRKGDRRSLATAAAAAVAGVGLSRTGTFVPLLVVAVVVVAAWLAGAESTRRTPAMALVAAYPVGAGLFGLLAERA
ncbi:MAG: hypothetical protein AAGA99_24150, partial [Actinomycetota bacterium]